MRRVLLVAAVGGLLWGTWGASRVLARGHCGCHQATAAAPDATATAANPRWYHGQWWYSDAARGWLVWRGNQWVDYRPANRDAGATAQANAAGGSADANRSFSYQPATPLRTFPGSVANEVIDGSYGIRGAESKANGSYH